MQWKSLIESFDYSKIPPTVKWSESLELFHFISIDFQSTITRFIATPPQNATIFTYRKIGGKDCITRDHPALSLFCTNWAEKSRSAGERREKKMQL